MFAHQPVDELAGAFTLGALVAFVALVVAVAWHAHRQELVRWQHVGTSPDAFTPDPCSDAVGCGPVAGAGVWRVCDRHAAPWPAIVADRCIPHGHRLPCPEPGCPSALYLRSG
jgi:hypothetical protein